MSHVLPFSIVHADDDRSKRKREANSPSPCLKRKLLSISVYSRMLSDDLSKLKLAQLFQKRHASAIRASKSGALDWNRFVTYDKDDSWFDVIGKVLQDPAVLQENIDNMDETGIMLSKLHSVKVLVRTGDDRGYRGARVKRTTITAVECISASGEALDPMIIWPASTHRANWTTQSTPGWYCAYSDGGYTDSYLSLQWLKLVFDPQTKERANRRPRVLICDGFGTHETLEILEFCFANNIILCRLPSHTSHKLQPCDVSVFGPLKAAYRDQVERLERGGVGTIGKEHFIYLYNPARRITYEDLEKARLERATKEADKEAADKAKKAEKAKQAMTATPTADEVTIGKKKRGRKYKKGAGADTRAVEEEAKAAYIG
ncbi:hypothetical protein B0A54_17548 [Friedmanniomyces endolithicus]|uniref:DDE-1 domain-containing protein n=1 Tax=Friedmanniomyces endolithicus TaxID=329885 RepID=A0A4U0TRN9_9PEZI|nr:hypothetical protein B0A54_17548 [Friedmanniomyces endolithicus]